MSELTEAKRLEVIEKLKEIIPQGLVYGLGKPKPGELCVEAAICLALGEPHGDQPSCVHQVDRDFAIRLNDSAWSSDKARAEAMLPLAIAQLGTAGKDRTEWVKRIAEGTIRKVVPMALRAVAKKNSKFAEDLERVAVRCEKEGTREAALAAADAANAATTAYDAATTAYDAAYAAYDAAYDAAYTAYYAYYAYNAYNAVKYATYAATRAALVTGNDEPLKVAVQIALDAYAAET
jgi:hypothetical protein